MLIRFSAVSTIENSLGLSDNLPLSIFEISNTSFISVNRLLLASDIFLRLLSTTSGSLTFFSVIVVNPIMAFIGVLMSWDMVDRKLVFALLASSAFLVMTLNMLLTLFI